MLIINNAFSLNMVKSGILIANELELGMYEAAEIIRAAGDDVVNNIGHKNTDKFVRENYGEGLLRAKWYIIVESIAKQEKLEATREDIDRRVKFLAQINKKKEEEIRPKEGTPGWDALCRSIRAGKALKFVIDHAKVEMMPKDAGLEAAKKIKKEKVPKKGKAKKPSRATAAKKKQKSKK